MSARLNVFVEITSTSSQLAQTMNHPHYPRSPCRRHRGHAHFGNESFATINRNGLHAANHHFYCHASVATPLSATPLSKSDDVLASTPLFYQSITPSSLDETTISHIDTSHNNRPLPPTPSPSMNDKANDNRLGDFTICYLNYKI